MYKLNDELFKVNQKFANNVSEKNVKQAHSAALVNSQYYSGKLAFAKLKVDRLFKGDTDDMPLGDTVSFIRKFEIGVVGTEDLHTIFANANTRGDSAASASRLTSSNQIK
jgi:hypothetical protein